MELTAHPVYKKSGRSTPLEVVLRQTADTKPWTAARWIAALWASLIALDGATGPHFSINGLYLLPLCLTTWCLGRLAGLASGGVAVLATLYLNGFGDGFSAQASSVPTATAAWNAGMRGFAVVFIIMLIGAFRRAFDRERTHAQTDPLTGLGNRRSFTQECRRLELSAPRDNRILLCGIIDLDDFKTVNDRHGHSAGDDVLRIVAQALASAVRSYDVTARLGGDEFAFCLAVRDEASAERKTARLHHALIAALDASEWSATCSMGAATGHAVEENLRIADSMMFRAKLAGKSSWVFAGRSEQPNI